MRDLTDEPASGSGPVTFAMAALALLVGGGIGYNLLLAQKIRAPDLLPAVTASTLEGMARQASSPRPTIRLKYDPVVESVQSELQKIGYYPGPVDGVAGKRTRQAIIAYQKTVGLAQSGEASAELAEHIRYTREVAQASLFTGSTDVVADDVAETRAEVRRVQTGLSELAYEPGRISGELTDATLDAIRAFQRDRGLAETGAITDALISELEKLSGQSDLLPQ
ncbi:MAG: peptidoglycan-binding protein [Alphaproteobacteria bacterium]|nr:peptidoglycan-binding protein [Alphaproteobacteria bacterium]